MFGPRIPSRLTIPPLCVLDKVEAPAKMSISALTSRTRGFRTIRDTVWLYPEADIQRALAVTTVSYTDDGVNIVVNTLNDFYTLQQNIFAQTVISQPVGNTGFSLGVGTILEDLGKTRQFMLTNGQVLYKWQLVRQISPQTNPPIGTPGNSPDGTIGYVPVFCAFGPYPLPVAIRSIVDAVLVVRMG